MTLRRRGGEIRVWYQGLEPSPDVFALVMATGIVAIAARSHGYGYIAQGLAAVALATFLVLGIGFLIRAATDVPRVVRLTRNPDVALRMFTFVAACAVLGEYLRPRPIAASVATGLAMAGWVVLVPLAVADVSRRRVEQLRDQAHGAWLLPSVATSGLGGAAAQRAVTGDAPVLLVLAAVALGLAVVIYLAVASLILWRAFAAPLVPDEIPPDSWILMGALAICSLSGTQTLAALRALAEPPPIVRAGEILTVVTWIGATLWIPVLLYAQVWRSDHMVGTLHYEGVWWSAVFPIGMYSAATSAVGRELGVPQLATVSLVFFWIAFTIWLLVATGLVHRGLARVASWLRIRRRRVTARSGRSRRPPPARDPSTVDRAGRRRGRARRSARPSR